MFILIQDQESSTLTKPFTDIEKAIEYAKADIRILDDIEGVVELNDNDNDNIVAMIHSDRCENPYVVVEEELDSERN